MTFALPRRGRHQRAHHRRHRPKSGTAEFKAAAVRIEKIRRATDDRRGRRCRPAGRLKDLSDQDRTQPTRRPRSPRSTAVLGATAGYDERLNRAGQRSSARQRHRCCRRCTRSTTASGWISPGSDQPHRQPDRTCRRRRSTASPRFYALFARRAPSRAGRTCASTSACQSPASHRARAARTSRRVWACAKRAPARVRGRCGRTPQPGVLAPATPVQVRDLCGAGVAARTRHPARRHAAARRPRLAGAAAPGRRGRSREPRRLPRARRLRRAAPGARARRRRRDARGRRRRACSAAAARRSRPAASGRRWRPARRPPALRGLQRRRVRARARSRTACSWRATRSRVIEAMTIAGFATGCRARLHLPARRVPAGRASGCEHAIAQARAARLPRRRRHGRRLRVRHRAPPRRRRLHLRRGDGALQLDRGLPRRAAQQAAVPGRAGPVRQADGRQQRRDAGQRAATSCSTGGAAYARDRHRAARPGTRLFCVSGRVERPGRLRGAVRRRRCASCSTWPAACRRPTLQAVLLGGAAGAFVAPDELDMPLTFEDARAAGTTLGSGVVMVFDDTVDLRDIVLRIAAFFRDESCGQCVPCRVGTVRQEEAAAPRSAHGRDAGIAHDELALLAEIGAGACATRRSAASARRRATAIESRASQARRRSTARAVSRRRCSHRPRRTPVADRAAHAVDADRSTAQAVARRRGRDDPRRLPALGHRHADPLLRRHAHAGERLPGLRRRGRGRAHAGPGLLAQGRAGHGGADRLRARAPLAASWCSSCSASSVDLLDRARTSQRWMRALRRATRALRPPAPPPSRRARRSAAGHHHEPTAPTAATVAQPVKVDNELYVRDYCEVHPLLQVRRGLRRASTRTRSPSPSPAAASTPTSRPSTTSRCPSRPASTAATASRVCPTGALMFTSEHEMRAGGHVGRVAPDGRPTRSAPTAASAATLTLHVQDNQIVKVTSPDEDAVTQRQPVRQGALRLRARPGRRSGAAGDGSDR